MADEKNPKKVEEEVKTLRQEMDAITFKNKQANQAGKEKLKDKLSKNRERRVGAASKISGLGRLQGLATFKTK
jgi:hypothetical protein